MKWNEVVVVLRAGNLLHLVPTYQISAIAHVHLASEKGATDGMKSGLPQIQTIKQINATRDPPGRVDTRITGRSIANHILSIAKGTESNSVVAMSETQKTKLQRVTSPARSP